MAKEKKKKNQDDVEIIYLSDEKGSNIAYEFLDVVDYEGEQYAILLPVKGEDPDVEIVKIIDLLDEENGEGYVGLNDEEILSAVFDIFMTHVEEAENEEE